MKRYLSAVLALNGLVFASVAPGQNAAEILQQADNLKRGVCCILGAGSDARSLALDLTKASELLVHVRDPDPAAIESLQKSARKAGFPIQRLLAETAPLDRLPHATNTLDLVVSTTDGALAAVSKEEILRALRPEGVAIFYEGGKATIFKKPVPEGLDEWSHWEKAPDNNPVSEDIHIKAPYMTQFMAKPWYIGMPAITTAAGGRTFLAMGHIAHHQREWEMLNRIIARNGYNGTVLWERNLPPDYLVHRSAFVATEDVFHMINGDHVLMLDARTGDELGEIRVPDFPGDWKWIAMQDGILYALAGKPGDGVTQIRGDRAMGGWSWSDLSKGLRNGQDGKNPPHGFGDVLAAYDVGQKKVLWTHREESLIDSRGLAIRDGRFFLYCPEKYFRALDLATGDVDWTTDEEITLNLIEERGKGLTSTPGWRSQTMVVATPDTLVIQGQTRMNVVGISTEDGSMRWHKSKITNNPNAIYVDGKIVLAVGEKASHIVIEPKTGTVEDDLKFYKRACTRLTASPDSFFVRGEGMTRFDRASKAVLIDGAVRPACNDGVIPANGLIYLGPWACDCNLSLIGNVARCSAGNFKFDLSAGGGSRLEKGTESPPLTGVPFPHFENDWPTYRGNINRSASTQVPVKPARRIVWKSEPKIEFVPTHSVAAGGMIFLSGEDGIVRALHGPTGEELWTFQTGGPVKYPPTLANGRAYVGSGDGYAYCLDANSGTMFWRFRAAPVERKVMVYGSLSSTWPVNTGVLVHDNVAYFGAGIVDHDGTYVYAVDSNTGELIWENNTSGHLNPDQRKGVSVQGNLTILEDSLAMAGGNVVSPARFDLKTGKCLEAKRENGQPQSNGGKFVGNLDGKKLIAGGRILYSSPRNVSTKGSFEVWSVDRQKMTMNFGGIPPSWNDSVFAVANFKYGKITALDTAAVSEKAQKGFEEGPNRNNRWTRNVVSALTSRGEERWQSNLGDSGKFETLSLAVAPNAVITVARYQDLRRAMPQHFLTAMNPKNGKQLWQTELLDEPLPGALIVDHEGRILVNFLDGSVACFGE
ncbi:MAG: PQQ-binding-like beta-propeller repeat protein [Verrucomicrobiales bacterium]|nr:PQQ-binding-like beta-propeller repeat protein [Verrucomicrobiales bacterium]